MKKLIALAFLVFLLGGCQHTNITNNEENTQTVTDEESSDQNTSTLDEDESVKENDDNEELLAVAEEIAKNWYVRLVATDNKRGLESNTALLGELDNDNATMEQKLERIEPFTSGYIDIAFIDPAGLEKGEYKSHFLSFSKGEQVWRFTVLSDDTDADVTLSWRGLYVLTPYKDENNEIQYKESINRTNPILDNMQLVDEATGRTIAVINSRQPQAMSFSMDGSTSRTFRWERKTDPIDLSSLVDLKE